TKGERVIAVSRVIKDHILSNYDVNPTTLELIHGGYDPLAFDPDNVTENRVNQLREKWGIADDGQVVIMLPGRLTSWKGQDVFITALGSIADLSFTALCVGDTEDNPSFTRKLRERIASLGLSNKVKLVGHCQDMPAALKLADLVVSASSSQPEAFGKVAIEAMAMAKPIIATKHGGSLETILDNETGWLVEPSNPAALADVLRNVVTDKARLTNTGQKGRTWVQEQFTAQRMCEKTVDLYTSLLDQKSKRKTKEILSVVQLLPELDSGGVERGTLEMGKYLAEHHHRSFVISGGGRLVNQLITEGSHHIPWKIGAKNPSVLKYIFSLRRLLINEQIDILHLRSRMPAWIGYLTWKTLPKDSRPTLITTFHGFYSVNKYSAIMTKGMGIIAVSNSIEKHIRENYQFKNGIKLIFRGVDKDTFNPENVTESRLAELREQWGLSDDGRTVIMLPGRLTSWKGQDVFIDALGSIADLSFTALCVGDTEDNPSFTKQLRERITSLGLSNKIKLVGHCQDMPAALKLADLVVSASSSQPEAFGRTTIEAMAMGKAVIATAHGGSLETVKPGQSGWLVNPGDADGLARALNEALASPEKLVRYGSAGKEIANKTFTTKSMCEKTISYYRELIDQRTSSISR
ncbi:MAG: glycosyltransferase, partial [Desulfobacterales bacterium]|nr:glycosyltransferase [Desulfobacterales bacterium]